MKKQLLLIIGLIISMAISANPVTKEQAREKALSFLYSNNSTGRVFATAGIVQSQLKEVELTVSENAYYVYNIDNNKGFVIVSGDDRAETILGYSYEGSFDPENIPSNMKAWLDDYTRQIKSIRNTDAPAPEVRSAAKVPFRLPIPALLTCKWNQDSPFNDKCPNYKDGYGNRPTGCVATAVSQVMYYHKWPQEATPEIPGYIYNDDAGLGGDGKDKSVETLPSVKFDWDNMLDEYKRSSPKEKREAVATLMRYAGQAVNMQYCALASGARASDIASALRTYMNYDKGMKFVDRTGYSDIEWADIIYNELANNRPVLYSGTAPGVGGHQFVCDGYENDFFHFNWGWGGTSDGFFKLNALAPSQQGIGGAGNGMHFSERHHIVTGVQPPVEGSVQPEDTPYIGFLSLDDDNEGQYKKDDKGNLTIKISSNFGYNGQKDNTFTVGFGLFDADNKFVGVIKEVNRLFEAGYPNPKNNIIGSLKFASEQIAADGTYYMRGIVKSASTGEWNISEKGDKVYFKIQVEGVNVSITQYPYVNFEISDIHFGEFKYQNSEVVLNAKVKNIGDDITGVVSLTHNKVVESDISQEVSFKANEVKEVSLTFVPGESGELSFGIAVNGRPFGNEAKIEILPGENKNASLEFNPEKNLTSEGNFMDVPVEISNVSADNNYKSLVTAMMYTRIGFKYTKEVSVVVPVEVNKSGKANVNIHFDNLKFGETYYLAFAFYSNGKEKVYGGINENTGSPKKTFSKYTTPDAVSYYDEAGSMEYKVIAEGETFDIPANACYVEMPKASGMTINKSSNTNCIYNLKKGTSFATLDGCNLVKEGVSSEINLSDAYPYYGRNELMAEKVNLTLKVDNQYMAVWLPFAHVTATVDGVELQRATSMADMATSDYMLLPIVSEDESTVYCEFDEVAKAAPCVMFVNEKYVGKNIVFSGEHSQLDLNAVSVHGVYFDIFRSNRTSDYTEPVYSFTGKDFTYDLKKTAPFRVHLTSVSAPITKVVVSYPEGFDPAGIEDVMTADENNMYDVYTIDGIKVKTSVSGDDILGDLPSGIYVVNGKKFVK